MSTSEFNKLFEGYPDNAATRELRSRTQMAILRSLTRMRHCRDVLPGITFVGRDRIREVVAAVDALEIYMMADTPPAVDDAVERLRQPANEAISVYNSAARRRRGARRLKGQITEAEFRALKATYVAVVDRIITWLESVQPTIRPTS